ncbi:MAG: hypothetical protein NT172_17045 [Planctomycetota bacterium]|nr:hypothetical protein [Planctomycetota bacterium]
MSSTSNPTNHDRSTGQIGRGMALSLWPMIVAAGSITVLSILPHLINWVRYGDFSFWSNSDNFVYMAFHKANYFGSWHLNDPYRPASESGSVLYSWIHTVPISQLVHRIGWGAEELNLIWRLLGGFSLGVSVFLITNYLFRNSPEGPWVACSAALIFVSDPGSIDGRSFIQPFLIIIQRVAHPEIPISDDLVLPFFRVITPLTNYFLPIIALLAIFRAENRVWAIVAGIALGLNILTYFFYWTVLIPVMGILAVASLILAKLGIEQERHKKYARNLIMALIIGVLIGLPDVIFKRQIQNQAGAQAILDRLCRGQIMPKGDSIRFIYLFNRFYFLEISLLTVMSLVIRHRTLWTIWLTSIFAFIMTNSAILTGLEFENWHWSYLSHPMLELGLIYGFFQWLAPYKTGRRLIYSASLVYFLIGLGLRTHGTVVSIQPARYRQMQQDTKALLGPLEALQLNSNAALIGPGELDWLAFHTRGFQMYQEPYSSHISMLSDNELIRRHALNGYLQGLDRAAYIALESPRMCGGCSILNPEWQPDNVRRARVAAFLNLTEDEAREAISKYSAVVVLKSTSEGQPPHCGSWKLVAKDTKWSLWKLDQR